MIDHGTALGGKMGEREERRKGGSMRGGKKVRGRKGRKEGKRKQL